MGNPAHSRAFNYSGTGYTVVKSNEDANFPATNASDWWHPYRPWKTSGAYVNGTSYIGYTWTNQTPLVGIYIDDSSISGVLVQSLTTAPSTWTTRATITIPQCPLTGKYKGYLTLPTWTAYYGIRLLANTAADTTQWRLGSLIPVTSITTWGSPITPPFGEVVGRAGLLNDNFLSGVAEPLVVGNYFAELIVNVRMADASALRLNLLEFQRFAPLYSLFIRDISLATSQPTVDAWICRQVQRPALAYPDNSAGVQWQQIILREAA